MTGNVVATYEIATALPLEKAAAVIAGEQSSGTFVAVARETSALKRKHAATVVSVDGPTAYDAPTRWRTATSPSARA